MAQEGMNKVILLGNVGSEHAEVRYLPSGTAKSRFRLATNRVWIDNASGERKSHAEWHTIICWNKTAEWVGQNVKARQEVYVEGELRYRDYEKNGVKVTVAEVVCPKVSIRNWRNDLYGDATTQPAAVVNKPVQQQLPTPAASQVEDDIPF